jgi:hypothetical protein
MSAHSTDFLPFEALRPQILALLELHRAAQTEEARVALVGLFEQAFLATAWHVAQDLLENGWAPAVVQAPLAGRGQRRLKVVGGSDAA